MHIDSLIKHWRRKNVPHLPGIDNEQLRRFERDFALVVPDEMRKLYETTDGTFVRGERGTDHKGFAFWHLSDVQPDSRYEWAFIFADFMEESWSYAIALLPGSNRTVGAVYLLGDISGEPLLVADSLGQFIEHYLRDDDRLNPRGARRHSDDSKKI